ncbi:hypothetical protein DdX_17644 [Ditylenchus destructor]|uniref:Tudor domain-containing protein n=1 Tax=Ditylenchus destructor TaxID=166010 RepID=A0AAD4MNQ9_9BILA|nr:hypothetical protein DdX_17644 [Ditylenchus destructor]
MSATPNEGFRNPKLLPSDPIVVGGKYTGKVTSLDEAKNHFEFIVQLTSRQSDYAQVQRLLRQYDEILHYDPEPSPTPVQKGDYVLCRFQPSELRRCFVVEKILPENQILEIFGNESTAKVLCIDTGVEYNVKMSDDCFFALRPPFDRYPPFAVHCTFGYISALMHPQKQQVLQKHFKELMSNQTEVELNVVSVHSECFFPTVYQAKVTVRKGIDYVTTYPDFFWK